MEFKVNDLVKPSGIGRTENWEDDLVGKVIRIDEETQSVFVQWFGLIVEDEMSPEELIKIGEDSKLDPRYKFHKN